MRFKPKKAAQNPDDSDEREADADARLFESAALHARKGRYSKANLLLRQALRAGECSEAEALDLQARIFAQQGYCLQAESCWMEAQRLDDSNPEYENALRRLRQTSRAFGQPLNPILSLATLAMLVMLIWQVAVVNPKIARRQEAAENSISEVGAELAVFQDASQRRDRDVDASFAELSGALNASHARISDQLDALPDRKAYEALTARLDQQGIELRNALAQEAAGLAKRLGDQLDALPDREAYEALSARLERQGVELRNALAQEAAGLAKRLADADAEQSRRLDSTAAAVAETLQAIETVEESLAARVDAGQRELDASLSKISDGLNRFDARFAESLNALPDRDDHDALIARLEQQDVLLRNSLAQKTRELASRIAEVDAAQTRRIESTAAAVDEMRQSIDDVEERFAASIEALREYLAENYLAIDLSLWRLWR